MVGQYLLNPRLIAVNDLDLQEWLTANRCWRLPMGKLSFEIEQLFSDPKTEFKKLLHVHRQRNRSSRDIQIDFWGLDIAKIHDELPVADGATAIPAGTKRIQSRPAII